MPQIKHISEKNKCGLFHEKYYQCLLQVDANDVLTCKWIINSWNTCQILNKKQQITYLNKLM